MTNFDKFSVSEMKSFLDIAFSVVFGLALAAGWMGIVDKVDVADVVVALALGCGGGYWYVRKTREKRPA